ncbi:recombinase family protein [Kordiimonas marina]|uniref:recombinase family protein n=1 Tax=Kordiimonas marina TaxID=2872312 RepID=UPI001FF45868|nr:recombinase family protein [Kordiimonas marina]MCJ9430738.1 recombinase family protein [Kordiimonas marina]
MKTKPRIETHTLRAVRDGEFRDHYLVYDRKSTDEADNQKNSLAYQREENLKFAERSGFAIAHISLSGFCTDGVIAERHSGFKEDNNIAVNGAGMVQYRIARPKFKRLIQVLSKGYFKGVICLSWDRISRNKADDAIIAKLMRAGVDIQFAYAQYDNSSAGALHMDIDGMFAAHHSRVTSEKVRLAQFNLREQGICTHKAPIGYLNIGKSNDKPFDPDRAPIIRKMFKLYAKGNVGISDLTRWAREEGLTTPPMRRRRTKEQMLSEDDVARSPKVTFPVCRGAVQRILSNPFYIGKVPDNRGGYVDSKSHKPLVSDRLFYQVQSILHGKRRNISQGKKAEMPFRGMIRCSQCGRMYSPYQTKGILYLMVHCAEGCTNSVRNHRLEALEKQIGDAIERLIPSDRELAELDARTLTEYAAFKEQLEGHKQQNERRKRKLREDLEYLKENKLTLLKNGVYEAASLVAEEARLNNELQGMEDKMRGAEEGMEPEFLKDLEKLSELLKSAHSSYILTNSFKKAAFAQIVFSELSLSGNTLNFSAQNGFKMFESRFDSEGGATERRSELSPPGELKKSIGKVERWLEKS